MPTTETTEPNPHPTPDPTPDLTPDLTAQTGSPGKGPTASREKYFTRKEVETHFGVSYHIVRRHQEAGAYPNAYQRPDDQTWMIPLSDLVAFGDVDPTAPRPVPAAAAPRDADVAVQAASLEAENVRLTSEVEFLRRQVEGLVGSLSSLGGRS